MSFWKTGAGFLAGLAGAWLWPATESGKAASAWHAPKPFSSGMRSDAAMPPSSLARQLAARRRAAELTVAQARDLVLQFNPPLTEEDLPWWQEVIRRWAEEEPEAAGAWVQAFTRKGEELPDVLWEAALKPLARKDLRAALTAARRSTQAMWKARSELPAAAAERDPLGTMEFLEKEPRFLSQFGAKALGVWLRNDPAAACAWLSASPGRANLMAAVLPELAAAAPDRIPALMASLPEDSPARKGMEAGMAWAEVSKDFSGALGKFKTLNRTERESMKEPLAVHATLHGEPSEIAGLLATLDKQERYDMIFTMSGIVAGTDEKRIFAVIQTEGLSAAERNQLLGGCAGLGPQYAGLFMDAAKKSGDYNAVQGAANFWRFNLRERPAETLPVLQKMAESGQADTAMLLAIIPGMSSQDNAKWIATLPEAQQAAPKTFIALAEAMRDPAADLNALTELKNPAVTGAVLTRFFEQPYGSIEETRNLIPRLPLELQVQAINHFPFFGNDGPLLAPVMERILATGTGDSQEVTSALQKVVRSMPASEGKAIQWLDSLPPGLAVEATRSEAFGSWASENEVGASAWLHSQSADLPGRDQMISGLVNTLSSHDPESAWQWASTVTNPESRESLFTTILTKWQALDPAAAAEAEATRQR